MKKILSALLCGLLLLSLPAALAAEEEGSFYPDVPRYEWYFDVVTQVTRDRLMSGSDDGLFHPNDPVLRCQVITVLWRMAGSPAPREENWREHPVFPDVDGLDPFSPSYWYAEAAAWAYEAGIAVGYDDGSFLGGNSVTREELAVFLHRYALYQGQPEAKGLLTHFPDADQVSDWAEGALCHAVGMGFLNGTDQGLLAPQDMALRCQLAAILVRMNIPVAG